MPHKKKLIQRVDFKTKSHKGEYITKFHGKAPKEPRPALSKDFGYDILTRTFNTKFPPLEKFFDFLVANPDPLIKERHKNKSGTRRGVIYSMLSLQEIYYNGLVADCDTELVCIDKLLSAQSKLVTLENYEAILKSLSILLDKILYEPQDAANEQSKRSLIISLLENEYKWFTPDRRAKVVESGIFSLSKKKLQIRNCNLRNNTLKRLSNVVQISDYHMMMAVQYLKKRVQLGHDDWLHAAIQLVQVSVGSRWIEVAIVSQFSKSKHDPKAITITGVAKEGAKIKKKKVDEVRLINTMQKIDDIEGIQTIDENENIEETLPEMEIESKPVLFMTPKEVIDLVKKIRTVMSAVEQKKNKIKLKNDRKHRKYIHNTYFQQSVKFFDDLWYKVARGYKFNNKTHTWRKIYANYSHQLWNPNGNLNAWIMKVLGHITINTSFAYADVVIIRNVQRKEKIRREVLNTLVFENTLITTENSKLRNMLSELKKEHFETVAKVVALNENL